MNIKAEETRIRYLYRDMVLRGRIKLPFDAARKLVGPDCAYHLYSVMEFNDNHFEDTDNKDSKKTEKTEIG